MTSIRELAEPISDFEARDELERLLIRIDKKLDLILSLLVDKAGRKEYEHKALVTDISESGIGIISPVKLAVGTNIELGVILPSQPYRTMDVAGEVIWEHPYTGDEAPSSSQAVGIQFTDIPSHYQDEIVHWIFQKQREELRRRRNGE
jgi:c-di-GMP-binding flagellar brake protein YcgR